MIDYDVREIRSKIGMDFIRKNHYSHSCHNGPTCFGLFDGEALIGVVAFATPGSESVRSSVFGPDHVDRVTELHRLFIHDVTPKNTETWFMSRAIKLLLAKKPGLRAILSFSDRTEGHEGTIYKAMNFMQKGNTGRPRAFWRDPDGRLRHPRQNGVNISKAAAEKMGWTREMREVKDRHLLIVGTPSQRKSWSKRVIL